MRRIIDRLVAIDCALFDRVAKSRTPVLDAVLPKLTLAANNSAIWVVASGLLTALGGRRGKRAALRGMGSIGITSLFVNQVVKRLGGRAGSGSRRCSETRSSSDWCDGHARACDACRAHGICARSR